MNPITKWGLTILCVFFAAVVLFEIFMRVSVHYGYTFYGAVTFLSNFISGISYAAGVALIAITVIGLVVEINNHSKKPQEIGETINEQD